jgi:hypothetical protein
VNDIIKDVAQGSEITHRNTQTDMMVNRQAQEVQVSMLAAKRFPRDEVMALDRIKATCQRKTLADQAIYAYPRGGQMITGPSIRLAEAIAQYWGNIDAGVIELDNRGGRSEMMAYAWDLETNTRVTKTFSVEHVRDTKQGRKALTDARDIYEATANFGARRMRACILSIVPGDVVEMAVDECRKTIASADKRPVKEIVDSLIKSFKELSVSKAQLEDFLGKQLTGVLKEELVDLGVVYKAIKDDKAKVTDYFPEAVKATDDQKEAIVKAQKEVKREQPSVQPNSAGSDKPATDGDGTKATERENKEPETPKKSVKEMVAERGWDGKGKQTGLVNDGDDS